MLVNASGVLVYSVFGSLIGLGYGPFVFDIAARRGLIVGRWGVVSSTSIYVALWNEGIELHRVLGYGVLGIVRESSSYFLTHSVPPVLSFGERRVRGFKCASIRVNIWVALNWKTKVMRPWRREDRAGTRHSFPVQPIARSSYIA
jgi:hypothetical protein